MFCLILSFQTNISIIICQIHHCFILLIFAGIIRSAIIIFLIIIFIYILIFSLDDDAANSLNSLAIRVLYIASYD